MDLNLLIGAAIAIVSSSITAILTHHFQITQMKKKREMDLDDERFLIKKDIVFQRLLEIENLIHSFAELYYRHEYLFRALNTPTYDYLQENYEHVVLKVVEATESLYLLDYFGDNELSKNYQKLILISRKIKILHDASLQSLQQDENVNHEIIRNEFESLNIKSVIAKIIKRIDFLKENYRDL